MPDEVGYKKPPVHTRFQKGRSGNSAYAKASADEEIHWTRRSFSVGGPGGRPGPKRDIERRFGDAVEAALVLSPQELVDSRPASEFERMAEELVCKAALPNVVAIRIVLSFLPDHAECVRRAQVPAGILDQLMRVYMAEEARASGLPEEEAEAESQGIIALRQEQVRPLRNEAVRQAEDVARVAKKFVQGIRGDEASRLARQSQRISRHLRRLQRAQYRALRDGRSAGGARPPPSRESEPAAKCRVKR
jgi:hypothetical protein